VASSLSSFSWACLSENTPGSAVGVERNPLAFYCWDLVSGDSQLLDSMEGIAPADTVSSDILALRREVIEVTFENQRESRRADRAERDKQRAEENSFTIRQQADKEEPIAQQRAEEDTQDVKDYASKVRAYYKELLQISLKDDEELQCERNQALTDKDRAIADKKQAIADRDRAIANKKQVMADLEQSKADREYLTAYRDRAIAGMEQATADTRQATTEASSPIHRVVRFRRLQRGNCASSATNLLEHSNYIDQSYSAESFDESCGGRNKGDLARDGLRADSEVLGEAIESADINGSSIELQEHLDVSVGHQQETQQPLLNRQRHSSPIAFGFYNIESGEPCVRRAGARV